jgi:Fur family transcriptional regulator, ferric uptake regulator
MIPVMDVGDRLRTEGYRLTPQRRMVWEVLRRSDHHLTAEEIHAEVVRTAPDFNLASVYRTLTLLAELDMAKEVQLGGGKGHWEINHPDDDFHLVCRGCGTVQHHPGDLVEQVRRHLAGQHGFSAENIDLVVHGICADCKRRGPGAVEPAATVDAG